MIKVGECYYHNNIKHIVIAVSEKYEKVLVLSITSGDFDKSCELSVDDIIDNMGNHILKHTSYICYKFAFEFEGYKTFEQFRRCYDYRCDITQELLERIQKGARTSRFLPKKFKKYFE